MKSRTRRRSSTTFATGAFLLMAGPAVAQSVDCARLQAQIANFRGNPTQSQRFLVAAQRQQHQLDQVAAYANSLGCQNRQFLFFGSPPPPQCNQINQRIQSMQASVERLQQQAQAAGGEGEKRELQARYQTYCGSATQASLQGPRSFFQQLFGGGGPQPPTTEVPIGPAPEESPQPDQTIGGGSKAVCVRTCDGGFFPVSYVAGRSQYGDLQAQCNALCPNVQTQLYTYSGSGSGVIDQAVSAADGKPYSSMPNAGLFKTHYDAACTCKPPHESWAQALAGAEQLAGEHGSDIVVTPEKSDQMARAVAAPTPTTKAGKKAKGKASAAVSSSGQTADDQTAVDLANSAAAPTVGEESADIGAGAAAKAKVYSQNDGQVLEETGPDGVKRRVRIISPQP